MKCHASGLPKPYVSRTACDKILTLQGLHADEVTSISKFTNTPETTGKYLNETVKMISSLDRCCGGSRSELEWRVPIADASFPEVIVSTALEMKSYKALRHLFTTKSPTNVPMTDPVHNSVQLKLHKIDTSTNESPELYQCATYQFTRMEIHHYKEGVCGNCTGSWTSWGFHWHFQRWWVLFLPRRNMKVDHGWGLVGECYVHGIMAGEGFKEKDTSTIYLH